MRKLLVLVASILLLSGCEKGLQQLENTEIGIVFRRLPPFVGGGLSSSVVSPGEMAVVMPWDTLYRFDTKVKSLSFGSDNNDYIQTRASDGNEVALSVRVEYRIDTAPDSLKRLLQVVTTTDDGVRDIVAAVARSDVRRYMNELKTSEFFVNKSKYDGQERVLQGMSKRLAPYGIVVTSVNIREHRFERTTPSGEIDRSYQEKINEVQAINEATERERLRKATVKAQKERELQDAQAEVNRQLGEVVAYKQQLKERADAYFIAKTNESQAIRSAGEAEVKGIVEQVEALNGPGGEALLRLELGRQLVKAGPKFVLLGEGKGASLEVQRLDTNQLLSQLGAFERDGQGAGEPVIPFVGITNERASAGETKQPAAADIGPDAPSHP